MSTMIDKLYRYHDKFFALMAKLQSPFLFFVRVYWGWQLAQSGWGKLHNLEKVTEFFTSLSLPMPAQMAVVISCLEFFGGILLAIGLFSRLISLVLTINLFMAYVTADREALFSIFSDPDKFTAAAPYNFLLCALIILIFGPGLFCADHFLRRLLHAPVAPQPDTRIS